MARRNSTHSKPGPLEPQIIRERMCLMCNRQFVSSGPGNRICPKCSHHRRSEIPVHTLTLRG